MAGEILDPRESCAALSRWPVVQQAVDAAAPLTWCISAPAVLNAATGSLLVNGLHLTSCVDRAAEAALQAQTVPVDAEEVTVYGFALGDLPDHLIKHRPRSRRLRVVVFHPALVTTALSFASEGGMVSLDWLTSEKVELVLGRALPPKVDKPFAVAPAPLYLAEDAALPLRDAVLLALSEPYEARRHREREPMLQASMAANMSRLESDCDVAELFASASGSRVVVAAGGPSLSHGMSWIQENRSSIQLIAVSTALLPLKQAGVLPDVVVVVDPKPVLAEHFEGLRLEEYASVKLVYTPAVQPKVVEQWLGPRFCAYLPQPRFAALKKSHPRGELYCGATVTHAAADLAVKLGAAEVVLWGADFAYLEGRSHALGAVEERGVPDRATATVISGDGRRLHSDLSLIGFLRDLEGYIARTPHVTFYLGSQVGAAIRGTQLLPR